MLKWNIYYKWIKLSKCYLLHFWISACYFRWLLQSKACQILKCVNVLTLKYISTVYLTSCQGEWKTNVSLAGDFFFFCCCFFYKSSVVPLLDTYTRTLAYTDCNYKCNACYRELNFSHLSKPQNWMVLWLCSCRFALMQGGVIWKIFLFPNHRAGH